jgi:glycosyltransferase involved in cell wall biosynthesis
LKFLFVTPALGIGGVERWFLTLARHIRQVRPHAIVLTGDKSIHPQILAEAESICPVIRAGENPLEARPLLWGASKACDAVLTWGFQPNLAYLVKHLDLPTVLVSHGSEELNQLLLANAPYATHYAAVSQVAADAFPHPYREQVTVIPNGSDVERSAPNPGARQRLRGEWGVGDRTVILYLGRLSPEKRPDLVLMAAKELGESYAVVLCGPPVQKSWDRIQEINGNIPNMVLHIDKELEPRSPWLARPSRRPRRSATGTGTCYSSVITCTRPARSPRPFGRRRWTTGRWWSGPGAWPGRTTRPRLWRGGGTSI